MSIDQAGMAAGQKAAATSDSRPSKGGAVAATDAGDTPQGGFASLLSALAVPVEPPVVAAGPTALALNDEEDLKDGVPVLGLELPGNLIAPPSLVGSKVDITSLADQPVLVESDGLNSVRLASSGVDKVSKHVNAQGADHLAPDVGKLAGAEVELAANVAKVATSDEALRQEPLVQKAVQARRALGVDLQAEAANARLEAKAVKSVAEFEVGLKDAMQVKLSSAGELAARLLEPAERPRGKSFGVTGSAGAEAGWAQYAHHARSAGDITPSFTIPATAPAQMQVADKVSYWVTQGIQNAELKLEGFGDEPVEISILLKGGEVRVDFRSDQPEVRQMLEGALGQLKESLQREGVLLSGVTVGGSGSEGGGRQESRKDSGANQKREAEHLKSEVRIQRPAASIGRSLDLFV
ncbi:flagellar hook-length control protein FliK [Rhodoferax sp. PAMC 29310]|uniref:flagellar hook-length control protein FliK n=1 Tax=Rhodoferax sp. PAMC 29310 TaxID=2822760 RepID=UPI001B336F7C|nr:flagellar hook-length control protein FliK [Rhodoferax sp. PAMC 29310]